MNEEKRYLGLAIDVIRFTQADVITTSDQFNGEDGQDIFDDR